MHSEALIWGQDRCSTSRCSHGVIPIAQYSQSIKRQCLCAQVEHGSGAADEAVRCLGRRGDDRSSAGGAAGGGRGTDRVSDMFDFVSASDTVKKQNRRGAARFKAII